MYAYVVSLLHQHRKPKWRFPTKKRETQKDSFLSSDLEEGCANVPEPLPEYPQTSTQLTAAILPPPSASAEEVRDYIRGVLVVKHGTTPGYAEEFAIKWQLGRGWDLRELGKQKFTQLFGELIGTHLCRDVKEEVNAQNNAKAQELIAPWEMTRKPRDYYSE